MKTQFFIFWYSKSDIYWIWSFTIHQSNKKSLLECKRIKNRISKFFRLISFVKIRNKWPKNHDFQILINRPIRPIFIFYQWGNVNIHQFRGFPSYWTYNLRDGEKIEFFGLRYQFLAFFDIFNFGYFVEISTRVEISTVKIISKKTYNVLLKPT